MQMKFQFEERESGRGNDVLLTERLKKKFISGSLYKVNQKKSKFHCYSPEL